MRTEELPASAWKTLNLIQATHAHISRESIYIGFRDKLQGVRVEYSVKIPNEGFIDIRLCQTIDYKVNSYMVDEGFVRYLKDIHTIEHYPKNSMADSKLAGLGLVSDTVIANTKKGFISFSTVRIDATGKPINVATISAITH